MKKLLKLYLENFLTMLGIESVANILPTAAVGIGAELSLDESLAKSL